MAKENATTEAINKYVDQAMQASVPRSIQMIVIMISLILDKDPIEAQKAYMDSQHFIDKGFRKLVSGEAAQERLDKNMEHYKSLESDT